MKNLLFLLIVLSCCTCLSAKTFYNWKRMPGNYGGFIGCMQSDKNGTIFAGSNALFSSSDDGESWNKISDNFSDSFLSSLMIIDSIYFGEFEQVDCDEEWGYSKYSTDNGNTWKWDTTYNYLLNRNVNILKNGKNYFRYNGKTVLASLDSGNTWQTIDTSDGSYGSINSFVLDRNGYLLYHYEYNLNRIKKYNPKTKTISIMVFDSSQYRDGFRGITVDSLNNYFLSFYSTSKEYILKSGDEGKSWKGTGFKYPVSSIVVTGDNKIFIASEDNGMFYSNDNGSSWIFTPSVQNNYDNFFVSPKGSLFAYGWNISKFVNGKWIQKVEGLDVDEIINIAEKNNTLYSSSSLNGINSLDNKTGFWNSYFFDNNEDNNHVGNFAISGNNIIAVNYDNITTTSMDSNNWIIKSPYKYEWVFCSFPSQYRITSHNNLVCFSNLETNYSYISTNSGTDWIDLHFMLDSSSVSSNFIDKNDIIFISKTDNPGVPDSIKSPVIFSSDKGSTWHKTNINNKNSGYFVEDISGNVILICDSIFYKYNSTTNGWDTLYQPLQKYNTNVIFIDKESYLMIPSKYEWPSTDVVLVVNMVSGTIDTINIDYDYIAINNFFKASDGTIYAATDRGVFKLDITTDVEPINGNDNLINIYPNPASDLINICYQNSENIKSIKIINQLGEIVYDNDVIASGNYIQISTKEFASGIYYCLMKMEDRTVSQKFVIVR